MAFCNHQFCCLPLVFTWILTSWLHLSIHPSPMDYLLFWYLRQERIDGPELKTGQDWWSWGRSMYGTLLEEFCCEVYQYQWQLHTESLLSLKQCLKSSSRDVGRQKLQWFSEPEGNIPTTIPYCHSIIYIKIVIGQSLSLENHVHLHTSFIIHGHYS